VRDEESKVRFNYDEDKFQSSLIKQINCNNNAKIKQINCNNNAEIKKINCNDNGKINQINCNNIYAEIKHYNLQ